MDVLFRDAERGETVSNECIHLIATLEREFVFMLVHRPRSHSAKHVHFVENDLSYAIDPDRALERLHVHPVRLTASPGRCTEFLADVSDLVEDISIELKFLRTNIRLVHFGETPP